MAIKVLIVDDHAIVREGLHKLLDEHPEIEVVGEAADCMAALEMAAAKQPGVILLDIAMPGVNGLEGIPLLREKLPSCRIVVLSMHGKESYVRQALELGALAYVLKASPSADIIRAIRAAHRGEYFLSPQIRADVIKGYLESSRRRPTPRGYDLLSEREQQVFRLIVQGRTNREIADILCISSKTIEKHRASITKKLGVHGRLELLKYAIKIGVVDPDLWPE